MAARSPSLFPVLPSTLPWAGVRYSSPASAATPGLPARWPGAVVASAVPSVAGVPCNALCRAVLRSRSRAVLPACSAFEASQPTGSRSMGKTTIGVRCLAPSRWTVYLAAQIRVMGSYVVTREPLPANHILSAVDRTLREGDLGSLPADVVTNADDLN